MQEKEIKIRIILSTVLVLLVCPICIFFSMKFAGARGWYFSVSVLLVSAFIPFITTFESKKQQAQKLVIIACLSAAGVVGRAAFAFIPQFKPVAAIVIISGICFGAETGFMVGAVTAFVSNFLFTQGTYTPWQMLGFGLIGFFAGILFRKGRIPRKTVFLCIYGAASVLLIYGLLMNLQIFLYYTTEQNTKAFIAVIITSLPMDLMHAASTVAFLILGAKLMIGKLDRICMKYGIEQ